MPVSRSRARAAQKRGHKFEKRVARWAKRYFDAEKVETNILMNASGLRDLMRSMFTYIGNLAFSLRRSMIYGLNVKT